MASVDDALERLADHLRDDPVIAPHVRNAGSSPAFGRLVAAGPRAAEAPGEYAFLVEAIREGYLLHYSEPRIVEEMDQDLRLLAGDYLYALGLEQLAARGDLDAVEELADLISLSAQLHARADGDGEAAAEALWLAAAVAVAAGPGEEHERGKELIRDGNADAAVQVLANSAGDRADRSGIGGALEQTAEQVGFAIPKRG
jgi:hypothetical protein